MLADFFYLKKKCNYSELCLQDGYQVYVCLTTQYS